MADYKVKWRRKIPQPEIIHDLNKAIWAKDYTEEIKFSCSERIYSVPITEKENDNG